MRPSKQGIPKIVIVITDGRSNDKNATIEQAGLIKNRGFTMISVAIGSEIDQEEINSMSSTPADVYSVDDFTKILEIVTDITRANCKTPAIITEVLNKTQVLPNTYKYFEYDLNSPDGVNKLKNQKTPQMALELEQYSGSSELFYSFYDKNPKSDEDFLKLTSTDDDRDENYVDDYEKSPSIYTKTRRANVQRSLENTCVDDKILKKSSVYKLENVNNSRRLYFSVKGVGQELSSIKVNVRLSYADSVGSGQAGIEVCQKKVIAISLGYFLCRLITYWV